MEKEELVPDHICRFSFKEPSTKFQSNIIVERFRKWLPDYGVKYWKYIEYGVSSTYNECKSLQ